MRKFVLVIVIVVLAQSCNSEPELAAGVSVAGVPELVGATVYFDDRLAGQLQYLMFHGTWFDRLMKRMYPGFPGHDVVALNIDMSRFVSSPATHIVRVEKQGLPTASHSFMFPPGQGSSWVYLFVMADGSVSERAGEGQ